MQKRKRTKKQVDKSSKFLAYLAWFLAILALMLISLTIGYYFGINDAKKINSAPVAAQTTPKHKEKTVKKRLKEVLEKEQTEYISAAHEIDDEKLAHAIEPKKKKKIIYTHKPKLAIIIDDVNTASEVRAIKSLHIPITMSFFPPRPARPNTPKLAARESFYMVHLPLEAMHFKAEEPHTLRIHDSQQVISARIKEIKKEFPRVQYINNHTGSKFTSNEVAMNRLIFALNANHIHFIDSRTTAKTMAPKVLKNFGLKYVARDVFLDDKMDKADVIAQIKEAIKVAKTNGHAIVIGHPHKNTLAAIAESKSLFKDVDLVQVNKVY